MIVMKNNSKYHPIDWFIAKKMELERRDEDPTDLENLNNKVKFMTWVLGMLSIETYIIALMLTFYPPANYYDAYYEYHKACLYGTYILAGILTVLSKTWVFYIAWCRQIGKLPN